MGGSSSREDYGRRRYPPPYDGGQREDYSPRAAPPYNYQDRGYNYRAAGYSYSEGSSRNEEGGALYSPRTPARAAVPPASRRRLERKYSKIADEYSSLEEVTEALAMAGLESSNLIVGVDFTKSNEWLGKISFNRQSLHSIGDIQNPYEQAISIIGRTLSAFDEDNLIPCYGFGDASTHDQDVFSFFPDERPCNGFEEVLSRYREIVPGVKLAGPTSFAPILEKAMSIVERSGGQYHVLLIIADGQVTRSVETSDGQLSVQEQNTLNAIVQASELPLSIVLVGVGDGPWDMMREFDDNIPDRAFDNFQFVNFTDIMSKRIPQSRKDTEFALAALMEIPSQYKATLEMGLLGHVTRRFPDRVALPPPAFRGSTPRSSSRSNSWSNSRSTSRSTSVQQQTPLATPPPPAPSSWDSQLCPICLANHKNMAFGCGHQTCYDCGESIDFCPICREVISIRIRLY